MTCYIMSQNCHKVTLSCFKSDEEHVRRLTVTAKQSWKKEDRNFPVPDDMIAEFCSGLISLSEILQKILILFEIVTLCYC